MVNFSYAFFAQFKLILKPSHLTYPKKNNCHYYVLERKAEAKNCPLLHR